MTRKDYVRLAEALRSARPNLEDVAAFDQWARDVARIADALAADNPRFDRDRFGRACIFSRDETTREAFENRRAVNRDARAAEAMARGYGRELGS